jgi:tetratricopeptide (TPR) repeat protein
LGGAGRVGTSEQYTFVDPKPTNTIRVMLVGESAIQGYPQPRHLCSSAFLQLMLQDAWPEHRVEVINLGTTAIASYPVLGILTEALPYQPDLVVIYTGHNEFFGAYGVASVGRAGSRPWMLGANRWLHSLALVQGLQSATRHEAAAPERTLMEDMMGETFIGAQDWRRRAAANILYHDVDSMIRRCRARGVPVLVCTPPTNERGLAPIGVDKVDDLPAAAQQEITALLSSAESQKSTSSSAAIPALQRILQLDPNHARAHYLLGQSLTSQGRQSEALEQYVAARDLDTMPWRAPSESLEAILRAAEEQKAPICDLVAVFRTNSPGQAIGWELMDDHVHPTLRGQALVAEAIVHSLGQFGGTLQIRSEARARLPDWEQYAQRLGTNVYDEYAVAHNMQMVFSAPFMRRNNPDAYAHFNELATGLERQFAPEIRDVLRQWQETRPFEGSRCPVTAAVAQLLLKQDNYQEALGLYQIAQRAVPQYSSWYLEYTYYALLCRQKLNGQLGMLDKEQARAAIAQGDFLIQHIRSGTDFTPRYTGFLHLLCGEHAEAIPCFVAIQPQQTGVDRLAIDEALFVCYVQTRQFGKAREVLTSGAAGAETYAKYYRARLEQLAAFERSQAGQTNDSVRTSD